MSPSRQSTRKLAPSCRLSRERRGRAADAAGHSPVGSGHLNVLTIAGPAPRSEDLDLVVALGPSGWASMTWNSFTAGPLDEKSITVSSTLARSCLPSRTSRARAASRGPRRPSPPRVDRASFGLNASEGAVTRLSGPIALPSETAESRSAGGGAAWSSAPPAWGAGVGGASAFLQAVAVQEQSAGNCSAAASFFMGLSSVCCLLPGSAGRRDLQLLAGEDLVGILQDVADWPSKIRFQSEALP